MPEEEKLKEFNDKLKKLLSEYGYGLGAEPVIDVDGTIKAKPSVFKVEEAKSVLES